MNNKVERGSDIYKKRRKELRDRFVEISKEVRDITVQKKAPSIRLLFDAIKTENLERPIKYVTITKWLDYYGETGNFRATMSKILHDCLRVRPDYIENGNLPIFDEGYVIHIQERNKNHIGKGYSNSNKINSAIKQNLDPILEKFKTLDLFVQNAKKSGETIAEKLQEIKTIISASNMEKRGDCLDLIEVAEKECKNIL